MVLEIDMGSRCLVGLLDAMPCDVAGLWYFYVLSWVYEKNNNKKIIQRKTVAIHNVFKKKTIKTKFLTNLILKK